MPVNEDKQRPWDILFDKLPDPYMRHYLFEHFRHEVVPQFNEKTVIQFTDSYTRQIALPVGNPQRAIFYDTRWSEKPGLKPAITRKLAPILKFFAEHKTHEADRPKDWKPIDIHNWGWVKEPNPVSSPSYSIYTLDFKIYQWKVGYFPREYLFYMAYAYDGLNDVLYVRYTEMRLLETF